MKFLKILTLVGAVFLSGCSADTTAVRRKILAEDINFGVGVKTYPTIGLTGHYVDATYIDFSNGTNSIGKVNGLVDGTYSQVLKLQDIQTQNGPLVDLAAYGAIPDTNTAAAALANVNAFASANSTLATSGGGLLFIRPGVYYVNSSGLVLSASNVKTLAHGVTLQSFASSFPTTLIRVTGDDNELSLTLNGASVSAYCAEVTGNYNRLSIDASGCTTVVGISGATQTDIDGGVWVLPGGADTTGVAVNGASYTKIRNIQATGASATPLTSAFVQGSGTLDRLYIQDNNLYQTGSILWKTNELFYDLKIQRNRFYVSDDAQCKGGYCFLGSGSSSASERSLSWGEITDNEFSTDQLTATGASFYVDFARTFRYDRNRFLNEAASGFDIVFTCSRISGDAAFPSKDSGCFMQGNYIQNGELYAVQSLASFTSNIITSGTITMNLAPNSIVSGNVIASGPRWAIKSYQGDDVSISANHVTLGEGVTSLTNALLDVDTGSRFMVVGNTFYASGTTAVEMSASTSTTSLLTANLITGSISFP